MKKITDGKKKCRDFIKKVEDDVRTKPYLYRESCTMIPRIMYDDSWNHVR